MVIHRWMEGALNAPDLESGRIRLVWRTEGISLEGRDREILLKA